MIRVTYQVHKAATSPELNMSSYQLTVCDEFPDDHWWSYSAERLILTVKKPVGNGSETVAVYRHWNKIERVDK